MAMQNLAVELDRQRAAANPPLPPLLSLGIGAPHLYLSHFPNIITEMEVEIELKRELERNLGSLSRLELIAQIARLCLNFG